MALIYLAAAAVVLAALRRPLRPAMARVRAGADARPHYAGRRAD